MSKRRWTAFATGVSVIGLLLPATGAYADDTGDTARIDEAASSESADITAPSERLPMDAAMRNATVQFLRADLAAPGRTTADRMRTQMELAKLVGTAAAASLASSSAVNAAATPPNNKLLIIAHAAQEKGYWCGPASAYMMLKYLGYSTSRYNGVGLSQTNLASATYLGTTTDGTPWTGKGMANGINKWMQATYYVQLQTPSLAVVRGAFTSTINGAGQPVAADTVEFQGGTHYNGHPDRTIGHWIVGYGYANLGTQTYWLDPATSYYPNASKTFTAQTADFMVYLQSNGIMS